MKRMHLFGVLILAAVLSSHADVPERGGVDTALHVRQIVRAGPPMQNAKPGPGAHGMIKSETEGWQDEGIRIVRILQQGSGHAVD